MVCGDHFVAESRESVAQEKLSLLKQRKTERQKEVHERYAQLFCSRRREPLSPLALDLTPNLCGGRDQSPLQRTGA